MGKITLDVLLAKANNRLNNSGMDKDVAKKTRSVITKMFSKGIYVCVAQAYRSKAEQDALYAQGRTKKGAIVTHARGGQSNHNFGVAVDLCLYDGSFLDIKWAVDADFKEVVKAMKAEGFEWGGEWTNFVDNPHFQLYDAVAGEKKPVQLKQPVKPTTPAKPKPVAASKTIVPYPGLLYKGAKGMKAINIQRVQNAVGAKVTKKFDEQTKVKVIAYQRRKKLEADGVVGEKTWNMMF